MRKFKLNANKILGGGVHPQSERYKFRIIVSLILTISILLGGGGAGYYTPTPTISAAQTSWEFNYTGSAQEWEAPSTGKYYIEMYGASGGNADTFHGGTGGFASGYILLKQGQKLSIVVGGEGQLHRGGYNGGGNSDTAWGGGGCTFVATGNAIGTIENYSSRRSQVLIAAGGGGGRGSYINEDDDRLQQLHCIGVGGGLENSGNRVYANTINSNILYQYSENYHVYGRGGNGVIGGGGGGGGIAGGSGFDGHYPNGAGTIGGGWGGTGTLHRDVFDGMSIQSGHLGDGYCKIEYHGNIKTRVIVDMGKGGTLGGNQRVIYEGYIGTEVQLPIVVKPDYIFKEYVQKYGDARILGNKLQFGLKDSEIQALYNSSLNLKTVISNDTLNFDFISDDDYAKYYRLYQSINGTDWYFADLGSNNQHDTSGHWVFNSPGVHSITVDNYSKFTFNLYGASGGGSYVNASYREPNGYGGHTYGIKWLEAGSILYIGIGGRGSNGSQCSNVSGGWNGGGGGSSDDENGKYEASGGGGGATHIALNSNRGELRNYSSNRDEILAVAGGGGGREFVYATGGGGGFTGGSDAQGRVATQTSGYAFGYGGTGYGDGYGSDGVGGGGGGWYGGYASSNAGKGGGGGSGYIGGLVDAYTESSTHIGNGYAVIDSFDRTINKTEVIGVKFADKTAPNKPSNAQIVSYAANDVFITFHDNGDVGTTYYHKLESYDANSNALLSTSNITQDTITSGVKGYVYRINTNPSDTAVSTDTFTKDQFIHVDGAGVTRYLHIAAVDKAGNISGTYHFEIPAFITLTYDRNNESINRYGDIVSTTATGSLEQQLFSINTTAKYNRTEGADKEFKKTGYVFRGFWNTKPDGSGESFAEGAELNHTYLLGKYGTSMTLYAQWEPIRYSIEYMGNDNWNTGQGSYKHEGIRFDQEIELDACKFTRRDGESTEGIIGGYGFIGWGTNGNKHEPDYIDKQKVRNLRNTEGVYKLYALWKKEIQLKFNLVGGSSGGSSVGSVLHGIIYNSQKTFTFNIVNGKTPSNIPKYEEQTGTIDAYNTYDSNGINNLYKLVRDGVTQRFLGWSLTNTSGQGEPDWDMCTYNSSKKATYTVCDNTTLYAVWEPILCVDSFTFNRVLGNKPFKNGSVPKITSNNITAVTPLTESVVSNIIKSGEQGRYEILSHNVDANASIAFDSKILDIYKDEKLKDSLNPNTSEDLEEGQLSGLNRKFPVNEGSTSRTFYIPTYQSDTGEVEYNALLNMSKKSYYWEKVLGKLEEINIPMKIFITDDASTTEKIPSTLDELKTHLRLRIR